MIAQKRLVANRGAANVQHHIHKSAIPVKKLPLRPNALQLARPSCSLPARVVDVAAVSTPAALPLAPLDTAKTTYEASCAFSPYANWLIPGRLLLGRYPYVEPGRCPTPQQGEDQLRSIMGAGVTTFVSLQGELPPQAVMVEPHDGMLPYKHVAERVHASARPEALATAAAAAPESPGRLDFLHCPITDLGVPATTSELMPVVQEIQSRLQQGQVVYLHCKAGRGRAGTVGACLLGYMYGLQAEEALERVERAYNTRGISMGRSPETDEQQEYVARFIREEVAAALN